MPEIQAGLGAEFYIPDSGPEKLEWSFRMSLANSISFEGLQLEPGEGDVQNFLCLHIFQSLTFATAY